MTKKLLLIFLIAYLFLFFKSLLNFLPDCGKLCLLLVSELLQKVANLVQADVVPFLVLCAFEHLDLFLDFVGLEVVLLLGEILFNFTQVHELGGILVPAAQRSIDFLLKFGSLSLVLSDEILFYLFGLLLVLSHLLIPVVIKLCDLLDMRHLNLFFFLFML